VCAWLDTATASLAAAAWRGRAISGGALEPTRHPHMAVAAIMARRGLRTGCWAGCYAQMEDAGHFSECVPLLERSQCTGNCLQADSHQPSALVAHSLLGTQYSPGVSGPGRRHANGWASRAFYVAVPGRTSRRNAYSWRLALRKSIRIFRFNGAPHPFGTLHRRFFEHFVGLGSSPERKALGGGEAAWRQWLGSRLVTRSPCVWAGCGPNFRARPPQLRFQGLVHTTFRWTSFSAPELSPTRGPVMSEG